MSEFSQRVTPQATISGNEDPSAIVVKVRFEHCPDALGIGTATPRLSWTMKHAPAGWLQAGYEIEAWGPEGQLLAQTG